MMSTKLLLLIPCLCVGAISLRWMSKDRSIKPLKAQLVDLQQQLQGFDELKEEFVRHRIELGWEAQHLTEIEDQRSELETNIIHMAKDIDETRHNIDETRHTRKQSERWLSAWQDKVKGGDPEKMRQQLEHSLGAEKIKVNEAREKNTALKGLLDDLKSLLSEDKTNGI